jgi:hypothetical protein
MEGRHTLVQRGVKPDLLEAWWPLGRGYRDTRPVEAVRISMALLPRLAVIRDQDKLG